ncbi:hypothetical protein KGM_202381 [Danaus plexippus plexippus]|uniref:Uncharacterized protein n=1 Tax=Danaus plexippus plexippus TaxID=278856 RepID=A0A212EX09_DANPL|nr:hypothetical protein KGM_202381 [Danaus plexippus plexippus]
MSSNIASFFTITIFVTGIMASVIKIKEVPLVEGEVIDIVIREDPRHSRKAVADVKIMMENKKDVAPTTTLDNFVKATGIIPDLEDRVSIRNGNCPLGQKRKGPVCI